MHGMSGAGTLHELQLLVRRAGRELGDYVGSLDEPTTLSTLQEHRLTLEHTLGIDSHEVLSTVAWTHARLLRRYYRRLDTIAHRTTGEEEVSYELLRLGLLRVVDWACAENKLTPAQFLGRCFGFSRADVKRCRRPPQGDSIDAEEVAGFIKRGLSADFLVIDGRSESYVTFGDILAAHLPVAAPRTPFIVRKGKSRAGFYLEVVPPLPHRSTEHLRRVIEERDDECLDALGERVADRQREARALVSSHGPTVEDYLAWFCRAHKGQLENLPAYLLEEFAVLCRAAVVNTYTEFRLPNVPSDFHGLIIVDADEVKRDVSAQDLDAAALYRLLFIVDYDPRLSTARISSVTEAGVSDHGLAGTPRALNERARAFFAEPQVKMYTHKDTLAVSGTKRRIHLENDQFLLDISDGRGITSVKIHDVVLNTYRSFPLHGEERALVLLDRDDVRPGDRILEFDAQGRVTQLKLPPEEQWTT